MPLRCCCGEECRPPGGYQVPAGSYFRFFPLWSEVCLQLKCDDRDLLSPNEKATRQLGGLFFQGRIVLTEGKFRQNFLAKSYEPKKQGVKQILDNKCLYFQQLMKGANRQENCTILRRPPLPILLKRFN